MKVIYINKKTGKEVHYGDMISFSESGTYKNGYSWSKEYNLPVCNDTIPMLIEKGYLVQKEVKEELTVHHLQKELIKLEQRLEVVETALVRVLEKKLWE